MAELERITSSYVGQFQTKTWSALAGVPVFKSGPHTDSFLNLSSETSFGHYNPAFLEWVDNYMVPKETSAAYGQVFLRVYTERFKSRARALLSALRHWEKNAANFNSELARYKQALTKGGENLAPSTFFRAVPGIDPIATAFWVRRSIDGTKDQIAKILIDTMNVVDPSL